MLYGRIVTILQARGVVPQPGDIVLRDEGAGPYISAWNTAALGAQPSGPELAAIADATAIAAERQDAMRGTSRQKDVLATCALIVRARGIAAWNAMTTAQKRTATLAEADVWLTIREFIEDNL